MPGPSYLVLYLRWHSAHKVPNSYRKDPQRTVRWVRCYRGRRVANKRAAVTEYSVCRRIVKNFIMPRRYNSYYRLHGHSSTTSGAHADRHGEGHITATRSPRIFSSCRLQPRRRHPQHSGMLLASNRSFGLAFLAALGARTVQRRTAAQDTLHSSCREAPERAQLPP